MKKNICVITGSRAEYGILKPLMRKIDEDTDLNLQIIATGTHLSPEFGLTYKYIENDGFKISEKIEILMSSDTPIGISKSAGLALMGFAEAFDRLKPDLVVVLGDRYEIFAAAVSALISKIPSVHLHGGEITEGAFDDAFRHAVTKMSYLHFTSTEEYRKRVIRLGEHPDRVFNIGALGVENALNSAPFSAPDLFEKLNMSFSDKYFLSVFHPVTLEDNTAAFQMDELLKVLSKYKTFTQIFIKSNSDTNGRIINKKIDKYVSDNKNAYAFVSLASEEYLSLLKHSSFIIGNSSSGIIEAASFKVPSVNIGDRQKGRLRPSSVVDCAPLSDEIYKAVEFVLSEEFQNNLKNVKNIYGDGNTSLKMVKIIKDFLFNKKIKLKKSFYEEK